MGKRFWVVLGFITAALVAAMPAVASARLAYTEAVANDGSLTVTFNEPSQKKSASVNYQLSADATASWICPVDGTILGSQFSVNNTTTVVPGGNGHALGSISLAVASPPTSSCTQQLVLQQIAYTNVTLANFTTSTTYPLDSISQTFA